MITETAFLGTQRVSDADVYAFISHTLNDIGISAHLKGYNFLRVCVNLKRVNPNYKSKEMFRIAAEKFGTMTKKAPQKRRRISKMNKKYTLGSGFQRILGVFAIFRPNCG